MKIALDAMGSDRHPRPDVEGGLAAAREYGVEVLLVGNESALRPVLDELRPGAAPVRIVHAPDVLTMEDKGLALALKAKRKEARNSMAVGIDLVRSGEAQAFVTAGNTGAAAAVAYFRMGTLPGVERPALAPVFPTKRGSCVVLDIGANPDCKPENLLQFAIMGVIYAERVRGVPQPRVGLLSNGEEAGCNLVRRIVRWCNYLCGGLGLVWRWFSFGRRPGLPRPLFPWQESSSLRARSGHPGDSAIMKVRLAGMADDRTAICVVPANAGQAGRRRMAQADQSQDKVRRIPRDGHWTCAPGPRLVACPLTEAALPGHLSRTWYLCLEGRPVSGYPLTCGEPIRSRGVVSRDLA